MARRPRLFVPGVPQHIVQRGVNRQVCFFEPSDFRAYLASLRNAARKARCAVHAYVLMTNHVHLLVTPAAPESAGEMMQSLGRRYVRRVNAVYGRTGGLWEGRYRACLVDSERYLLTCYRYIELNPVRAGIVSDPAAYPWSSHAHNALGAADPVVTPHPLYEALGTDARQRCGAYREILSEAIPRSALEAIRSALNDGLVLGGEEFVARVEKERGRPARRRRAGRPPAR